MAWTGQLTYVPPRHLDLLGAVDVGQQPEAEALAVGGVCEAVDREAGLRGVERLPHPRVQLVVRDRAPEVWLGVRHWLSI